MYFLRARHCYNCNAELFPAEELTERPFPGAAPQIIEENDHIKRLNDRYPVRFGRQCDQKTKAPRKKFTRGASGCIGEFYGLAPIAFNCKACASGVTTGAAAPMISVNCGEPESPAHTFPDPSTAMVSNWE